VAAGVVNLSCSTCGAPIEAHAWVPFNISGRLAISYTCPKGHRGQFNDLHLAAEGRKSGPIAPVDDPMIDV